MKKTVFFCALLLLLSLPVSAVCSDSAKAAIVISADGGEVLYAHNEDEALPMASTTKLMTALVVLQRCRLDESVTVSANAAGTEGSSMYLREGESLSVEELLYGLLLASGNDAAIALAEHCAGDVETFVQLMNEKAAELCLNHTHYVNPNGLHAEEHFTSAADLAVLMRECLKNEDFCRISGSYTAVAAGRSLRNHNKLLKTCEGVCGGKTGYTMTAGRCLVSACERDGLRLICVTLNDRQDWKDHAALYDWAYENYACTTIEGEQGRIPLIAGSQSTIGAAVRDPVTYCLPKGAELEMKLFLEPFVFAPLAADRKIGYLCITAGDASEKIPLYPAE